MALIYKGKTFTPAPKDLHEAVCVDVVDIGNETTTWKGEDKVQYKIKLVFELAAKMEDGRPFLVSKKYTFIIDSAANTKSKLSKDLVSWRGEPFTASDVASFDLESMLDQPCRILVSHYEYEGKTFAGIDNILKSNKPIEPSGNYVRVKDRPPKEEAEQAEQYGTTYELPRKSNRPVEWPKKTHEGEDEIPF